MAPIGLFDSGVGGLSVWREVRQCLPHESTVYFADSAHCPYGSRPVTEVCGLSAAIARFLLNHNCKLVIVACNTASAAALRYLRAEFEVPIVGMEPALKPAAAATRTGHVGVLATAGTLKGYLFKNTVDRYGSDVEIHIQIGEGLVELVEAGHLDTPQTERLLRRYLEPMLAAKVDQLVLGCTHYPMLLPVIERLVAGRAQVIDPSQAVARQAQRVLQQRGLQADAGHMADHRFFTTGQPHTLERLLSMVNGPGLKPERVVLTF